MDRDRAEFIKRYFGVEWPGRHRFHLMINSTVGEELRSILILNSIDLLPEAPAAPAPQAQQSATQDVALHAWITANVRLIWN